MSVERLLDWAAAILQEGDSALATKALADHLGRQFHDILDKLEVLLSLDKRFVRDVGGSWQLGSTSGAETIAKSNLVSEGGGTVESIEEIIRLREEAIQRLLEEKTQLEAELAALTTRLGGIDEQLQHLGYWGAGRSLGRSAGEAKESGLARTEVQGEYAIEQHLDRKGSMIVALFHKLSGEIHGLGEDVQELPRKRYIAYHTNHNFCSVIVQASRLKVYIDIPHSELNDPQGIAEDCSTIGHWGTGDTRLDIGSQDEVEYAMSLIRQAHKRNR